MMSEPTSLTLLERARRRDPQGWSRLVALYGPLVEHWCRRGGARPADAADIAQEVFLAVADGLTDFERRRPGSFRAWVRGITRHKLLDYHRRAGRHPPAAGGTAAQARLEALPDPAAGGEDDAAETGGLYHRALDLIRSEFEDRTWRAFWQTAVDGRTAADAGAELGMTAVAVRVAKARVLARLRAEVGGLID
ncbi:MAG TPA: sigma-70 family RNA polymerase sigma factor [Gemmataceae bacterium]|jgi:RNA polymerase sigma-70 factor (ECF subfamily)